MSPQDKLLAAANAEVGYLEKRSNDDLDDKTANAGGKNYTKYARDLDMLAVYNGKKQGFAWCCVFVTWCFYAAFGYPKCLEMTYQPQGGLGAGVKYLAQYFKAKQRFYNYPQPGDVIFFGSKYADGGIKSWDHAGIVEKVTADRVYTIEGNTADGAEVISNGGCVAKKSYKLTYTRIAGYGRPDWASAKKEPEPWYAEVQAWAKDLGIADGTRPTEPATRAETWTMLKRLYTAIRSGK